ncbi:hypothetical protein HDK64DRAFT_37608 [Phyllosticta capitalensis]|uniref:Secreted protein n=1 Tax=Phyllosticta capitalensis TaxID=121624 RepID=A0ABR1YEC6_9PEZI
MLECYPRYTHISACVAPLLHSLLLILHMSTSHNPNPHVLPTRPFETKCARRSPISSKERGERPQTEGPQSPTARHI